MVSLLLAALAIGNGTLAVEFNETNAAFSVCDMRGGHVWRQIASPEDALRVTSAKANGSTLSFTAMRKGFASELRGSLTLDGAELVCALSAPAATPFGFAAADEIAWPCAFEGVRGERVLLPHGCGFAIPCEKTDLGTDRMDRLQVYTRDMNMGVWAQFAEGRAGYAAIIESPENCHVDFRVRTDGLRAMNVRWSNDMAKFGRVRTLRYVFFEHCDAMAVALRYRESMKRRGYYATLETKRRRNAKLAKTIDDLAGAPDVWYWEVDGDKAAFARRLKEIGFDNFLFGFATRKDLGVWRTADEVAAIGALDRVVPVEYDIYRDTMERKYLPLIEYVRPYWNVDAADAGDIAYGPDGKPVRGWKVALKGEADGGAHSIGCAAICDLKAVQYATKRLREELRKFPAYRARFLDVTGGSLGECWNRNHFVSRRDSAGTRRDLFDLVQSEFHLACGTEDGLECYVPTLTYIEGVMSAPNHYRVDGGRFMWKIYDDVPEKIVRGTDETLRVPFWEMVFHGCVIDYWYWCDYNNKFPKIWWKRDLFNVVTGTPPMYFFTAKTFAAQRDALAASVKRATAVAKATAFSPMKAYRFLTPDRRVQQSVFENGVTATVNFGETPYALADGTVLVPHGYDVKGISR